MPVRSATWTCFRAGVRPQQPQSGPRSLKGRKERSWGRRRYRTFEEVAGTGTLRWHLSGQVNGMTVANRALQQLTAAFQWAIDKMEWLPGPNPASERKVDRFKERPSKATIGPEQYNEILTAELAWVQPPILLSPDFDFETLADPEAYIRLAPRIERPRGKGDRHDSEKEGGPSSSRPETSRSSAPCRATRAAAGLSQGTRRVRT